MSCSSNCFPMALLAILKMPLANRDTLLVDKLAKFNKVPSFSIIVAWIGKNLSAKVTPQISFPYQFSSNWVCICRFLHPQLTVFPTLDFDDLSISRKLAMPIFLWHRVCGTWNVDRKTTTLRMRALGIVSLTASRFSTEILAKLEMLLTNQDNEVVEKLT